MIAGIMWGGGATNTATPNHIDNASTNMADELISCNAVVYLIQGPEPKHKYIGKTIDLRRRMKEHRMNSERGGMEHLYCAMRKYGADKFIASVICDNLTDDEAFSKEVEVIAEYDTRNNGMNMNIGGRGAGSGEAHPMYGRKHTEETKRLFSVQRMGNKHALGHTYTKSSAEKARLSESMKGNRHGAGRVVSQETLDKCARARAVLSDNEVYVMRILSGMGLHPGSYFAEKKGMGTSTISRLLNGKTYRHLLIPIDGQRPEQENRRRRVLPSTRRKKSVTHKRYRAGISHGR